MANRTITINEPDAATVEVTLTLTRRRVDGQNVAQVTAAATIDGQPHSATWDPTTDVLAVKNAARDFFQAVVASAKSRWGF